MEGFVFDKYDGDNALGFDEGPYSSTRFIVAPTDLPLYYEVLAPPHHRCL